MKKRKEPEIIVHGASGFAWNITKMAKELGWELALDFAKRIQEDKEVYEKFHSPFGRSKYGI